jgi:membrane protease YdiL (CAAX protease family)
MNTWRRTAFFCFLEGGLGVVALLAVRGWGLDQRAAGLASPRWLGPEELLRSIGVGILAAGPLLLLLISTRHTPLRQLVETVVLPPFRGMSWLELALISIAAGWGEEILFRGWIQTGLQWWWPGRLGMAAGWVWASLMFGAMHWLSNDYLLLACVVGLYLGGCLMASRDLVVPITSHAVYDFAALVYLLHVTKPPLDAEDSSITKGW